MSTGKNMRHNDHAFDALGAYLARVGAHSLLTADQEVELAQRIEAGLEAARALADVSAASERRRLEVIVRRGEAAKRRFVEANLRLVVANARRYAGERIDMLDLIQDGNLGLIRAVEKFDWRKGFKFSTYATWWIRQAMQRSIAKTDAMRVPMGAAVTDAAVRSARDDLEAEFGRKPTVAEIAELTGLAERKVEESLGRRPIVSLESPIGEDGGVMGDLIADGEAIDPHTITEQTVLTESLEAAIAALSPLHRTVLIMRFGLEDGRPRPVSEIAAEAGIAESEVRVVADEAVRSISEAIGHLEDLVAA